MHHTAAVCDLAVTLTSVLRNTADVQLHDVWELTASTLLGYQRHRRLTAAEIDVLGDLVLARLGLTLAIAARRVVTEVDNIDYIGQYDDRTRVVLAQWCDVGPDAAHGPVAPDGRHRRRVVDRPPPRTPTPCHGWATRADVLRRAARDRARRGAVAHRRRRHPLPRRLQQRRGHRARPSGPHPCRLTTARGAQHPQPLPPPADRGAGRAAARHRPGRTRHLPVHHLRHRGQRAGLADGDRPHRRQRRRRRRARLPRVLDVDGRPQSRTSGPPATDRPTSPPSLPRGPRPEAPTARPPVAASRLPPTTWPERATVRHSSWPTSVSPARASSTLLPSSSPVSSTAPTGPAPSSSPTRSSRASAAAARSCGGSRPPGSRRTS